MAQAISIDGGWSVWTTGLVRSAGFPEELILSLATLDPAARSDARTWDHARRALREVARRPDFREVLVWQNRGALRTGADKLLTRPAGATDSKTRQYEALIANYLQRLCTKNEIISFFGPIAWCTFDRDDYLVRFEPGASLLKKRTTFLEHWAADALAERLTRDDELRPFLSPRKIPTLRLEGTTLHKGGKTTELPDEYAVILAACDGTTPAGELAQRIIDEGELDLEDRGEIFEILESLAEQGLVTWTFEVPIITPHPDRLLRAQLEALPDTPAREAALALTRDLEDHRRAVATAAGDPEELDARIEALERTFEQITGQESQRHAGELYGARSIFYEDCIRDVSCHFGGQFLDAIGPTLALLLQSARWYTHEVGRKYSALLEEIFDRASTEKKVDRLDYLDFLREVAPHLSDKGAQAAEIVRTTLDGLQARWTELLGVEPDRHRIELRAEDLRESVLAAFDAPRPGWPDARYHSPDFMVAAAGIEAFHRGEFLAVLSELDVAINTLFGQYLVQQFPHDLDPQVAGELAPSIATIVPKADMNRAIMCPLPPHLHIELGKTRSPKPRDQVIAAAELVVERHEGRLQLASRDGQHRFEIIECFQQYLAEVTESNFRLLPRGGHLPRITIDRVVIQREEWRFEPGSLSFAWARTPLDRFAAAGEWRGAHGLPRMVFVRIPEERSPFYLDFESPHLVEILAKNIRKASMVTLTEMLPAIGESWLHDAEGRTYTSEIRIPCVDPEPWRPLPVTPAGARR